METGGLQGSGVQFANPGANYGPGVHRKGYQQALWGLGVRV